jgi:hypothetical protein
MFLFRKLIFAVLSIGLVLSVGSAVIGAEQGDSEDLDILVPQPMYNENAPRTANNNTAALDAAIDNFDKGPLVGDCYLTDILCPVNTYYGWEDPDQDYGDRYYNQRFSVDGPETLKAVWILQHPAAPVAVGDVDIIVWPTLGGFPDFGNEDLILTVPAAAVQPIWQRIDLSAYNLVYEADFHVCVQSNPTTGQFILLMSDDGFCGQLRSSVMWSDMTWHTMFDSYPEGDVNMGWDVEMCADKYADCHWESYYLDFFNNFAVPSSNGRTHYGNRISPALGGCDIAEIDWYLNGTPQSDPPWPYNHPVELLVLDNTGPGGLPGSVLWSKVYNNPQTELTMGGWNFETDVGGNVFFEEDVFVVVGSLAPWQQGEINDWLLPIDGGTVTDNRAVRWNDDIGAWQWIIDIYTSEYHPWIDAYICCLPLGGVECLPGEDWPTMGKTYSRVNRSLSQLGPIGSATDARCTLTKSWGYTATASGANAAYLVGQPAISGDYVVGYFYDHIVCLDMNDGSEVWKQPRDYGMGVGDGGRCCPTIHDGIVYIGGGDAEAFHAWALAGDGGGNPVQHWSFGADAFTVYAPSVVVDVGGTDVVYFCDNRGNLYALTAGAGGGADYYGSNPFFYGTGFSAKALTTDGTNIYFGVTDFSGTPNLYKIDCATGNEVWSFEPNGVALDGPGFQLAAVHPGETDPFESVEDGMAYEEDGEGQWLYFHTTYNPQGFLPVYDGGLIYKIDANTMAIAWVGDAAGSDNGEPNSVILDLASVLYGGWVNWTTAGRDYAVASYSKSSGGLNFSNTLTIPDVIHRSSSTPVLSCESYDDQNEPDWIVYPEGAPGYVHFMESSLGEYQFYRRIYSDGVGNANANNNPAVMSEGHLVITNFDFMTCLTNQDDRPRLELATLSHIVPASFGLPYGHQVTFEDVIGNTGCAPLEILGLWADTEDLGNNPNLAVGSYRKPTNGTTTMDNAADFMAEKHVNMIKAVTGNDMMTTLAKDKVSAMDKASAAPPGWLISIVSPTVGTFINPGDPPLDVTIEIDGTTLLRGLNAFYLYVDTDDPDYFLNYARKDNDQDYGVPTVQLGLLGGCLRDYLVLHFGVTGQNFHPVYNTTKIQTDASIDGGTDIDGHTAHVYGNDGLVYGWQDRFHVAMNWEDSWSNLEYDYESIMPDPYCGQDCDFIETTPIIAQYSVDGDPGAGYTDIAATAISYSYIDSIHDYRLDQNDDPPFSSWNWEWPRFFIGNPAPPHSQALTEGMAFRVLATEYGVTGIPEFNNFTIARHTIYSRYGYAIDDLYVGEIADFDIGNYSQANSAWDGSHSLAWMWDNVNPIDGWGFIKIPFGPGYEPMLNCINADYSLWFFSPDPEFDSIYVWLSERTGTYNPYAVGSDKRIFCTFAGLDLPAWGWYDGRHKDDVPEEAKVDWGYAFFGLNDLADATDPTSYYALADFVNMLCGYGRGNVNDDGIVDLLDVIYLNEFLFHGGNMPFPFATLGDVDADGDTDVDDAIYLANWYWNGGPPPVGKFSLPQPVCR